MLTDQYRLKKVRDFNLLMERGRWASGALFTVKWLELAKNRDYFPKKVDPDEFVAQLRFAFVVGVKVSKSAVKRNRLKRQMREVVRLMIKDRRLRGGFYVMVVAKGEALGKEYLEIEKDIGGLLGKVGVLR